MDQGQRRSYDASWVFFANSTQKYVAVDFFEPRDPKEFGSLQEAQNQIQAWNRQAAVNFVAGVMSGYSVAFEFSGAAEGMGAETGSEVFAIGQRAGTGASIAAAVTGVGIAPFVGKIGGETFKILKGVRLLEGPLSQFTHAGKFGYGSYNSLRKNVLSTFGKGSGLEVHHLIPERFAGLFGQKSGEMLSIVLTEAEHAQFTQAWRTAIPYANSTSVLRTGKATAADVVDAARRIYANHPDILKALGL